MKRLASLTSVIAATVFTVGLMAQGKTNFTGKWVQFDPDPAAAAAGGGGGGARGGRGGGRGGWGQTVSLTQDATSLKVERTQGQATVTETFKLDGTEGKNTLPAFREGGAPTEVAYTAKWDGAKLVINTKQSINMQGNAMTIESKRELSLDATGNLVVTTTTSGMGGGEAPPPVTVKYKKG
jgi:hypothetical protein